MLPQPKLIPVAEQDRMLLCETWRCPLGHSRTLEIGEGFVFDGASLPRIFWTLIGRSPYDPATLAPALLHDALYAAQLLSRSEADSLFRHAMWVNGHDSRRVAWAYWVGVRVGGWWPWWRRSRSPVDVEQARRMVRIYRTCDLAAEVSGA